MKQHEYKVKHASGGGIGLGSMELAINSDRPSPDEARTLLAELIDEHGLSFIDTADSYCLNEEEFGYCERLLSEFASKDNVVIASKIGMKRIGTSWKRCADPKYLRTACELSLRNLGVESIEICQLHAPDPLIPLSESIGEMSLLQKEGKIRHIGICNVTFEELEMVSSLVDIVSVQNPLSILFYDPPKYDPMLRFCEEKNIMFIAFALFGGHRNPGLLPTASEELNAFARREGLTIYELALLFLRFLSPSIMAIPGSASRAHITENLKVRTMQLREGLGEEILKL